MSLQEYLQQVTCNNYAMQSSIYAVRDYELRSNESDLLFKPKLFAESEFQSFANSSNPLVALSTANLSQNQAYQGGIEEKTLYGPSGKIYFSYLKNKINGTNAFPESTITSSSPVIEATVPLLRNRFGHEIREERKIIRAENRSKKYLEKYKVNKLLADAEMAYWDLVLNREMLGIQEQNLQRAQTLVTWMNDRYASHLAEKSDVLEAEASLVNRKLEMEQAIESEKNAAHRFNSYRNANSDIVEETLTTKGMRLNTVLQKEISPKASYEVSAALAEKHSAMANAKLGAEKLKPMLDLYMRYSINPQNPMFNQTIASSFAYFPNTAVGVKFSMPLDLMLTSKVQQGYAEAILKTDTDYRQKVYEINRAWKNYQLLYKNAEERLKLAKDLITVRYNKMIAEREKLKFGRTTTYKVILFEQEYEQAQLTRLNIEAELLQLHAQITHLWSYQ